MPTLLCLRNCHFGGDFVCQLLASCLPAEKTPKIRSTREAQGSLRKGDASVRGGTSLPRYCRLVTTKCFCLRPLSVKVVSKLALLPFFATMCCHLRRKPTNAFFRLRERYSVTAFLLVFGGFHLPPHGLVFTPCDPNRKTDFGMASTWRAPLGRRKL